MIIVVITDAIRADVNAIDNFMWTPLHHASHAGQVCLKREVFGSVRACGVLVCVCGGGARVCGCVWVCVCVCMCGCQCVCVHVHDVLVQNSLCGTCVGVPPG